MVDIGTLATVLVAIGTLALAGATFLSVSQNRRQSKALIKQTLILKSQRSPIINVKEFHFSEDKLILSIENLGDSPISSLVLSSSFLPAKVTIFADKNPEGKPLSPVEIRSASESKQQLYGRFDMLSRKRKLEHEGKHVRDSDTAAYLLHPARKDTVLLPHESVTYEIEPKFGIDWENPPPYWQTMLFRNIVDLIEENDIKAVAVRFDLLGKDWAEEPMQSRTVANFIVDFIQHKTLEEGYRMNTRPYFLPLGHNEFLTTIGALPTKEYLETRSFQFSPRSFEDE